MVALVKQYQRTVSEGETNGTNGTVQAQSHYHILHDSMEENLLGTVKARNQSVPFKYPLTMKHTFFAQMGGFALDIQVDEGDGSIGGSTRHLLTKDGVLNIIQAGKYTELGLAEEEILEKAKADSFAKCIACAETTYMIIQALGRIAARLSLPLTLLEVTTLSHVSCAYLVYFLGYHKPFDIQRPLILKQPWTRNFYAFDLILQKSEWRGFQLLNARRGLRRPEMSVHAATTDWKVHHGLPTPKCLEPYSSAELVIFYNTRLQGAKIEEVNQALQDLGIYNKVQCIFIVENPGLADTDTDIALWNLISRDHLEGYFVAVLDFCPAKELYYALPWFEGVCEATADIHSLFFTKHTNFFFQEYLYPYLCEYIMPGALYALALPLMSICDTFHFYFTDDDFMSQVGFALEPRL